MYTSTYVRYKYNYGYNTYLILGSIRHFHNLQRLKEIRQDFLQQNDIPRSAIQLTPHPWDVVRILFVIHNHHSNLLKLIVEDECPHEKHAHKHFAHEQRQMKQKQLFVSSAVGTGE